MSQPVVEDRCEGLDYAGLVVGGVAGAVMVVGFVGMFGYQLLRALVRVLT